MFFLFTKIEKINSEALKRKSAFSLLVFQAYYVQYVTLQLKFPCLKELRFVFILFIRKRICLCVRFGGFEKQSGAIEQKKLLIFKKKKEAIQYWANFYHIHRCRHILCCQYLQDHIRACNQPSRILDNHILDNYRCQLK